MFFFLVVSIYNEILNSCVIPVTDSFLLTKYYKPLCPHSLKIEKYIDEIDSILERNNIDLRMHYVDCMDCNCDEKNIVEVPTVVLSKEDKILDTITGQSTYEDYINMIAAHLDLTGNIFIKHKKSTPGKVVKLKEIDFDDGFEGPWLVLFNSDADRRSQKIFEKLASEYKNEINFGEIDSKRTYKIRTKVNIHEEPVILALYRGIVASFTEEKNYENMKIFCEKLIEPSFQLIDSLRFKEESKKLKRGEPLFLVFYSDLSLANSYFKRIAHEYKFKTKFFKSKDSILFERANIYPKPISENSTTDADAVILSVYKDGIFHQCPFGLEETRKVPEWIFHSHFPNLTRITNDNFSSIFHGLKPVLLLVTRNDQYIPNLERLSADKHVGIPFLDLLFATIDVDAFPLFMSSLLPLLEFPILLIYNPQTQKFYFKKKRFEKNFNFNIVANQMIKDYENNTLLEYPPKKSYKPYFIILRVICLVLLVAVKVSVSKHDKIN